MTLPKRWIVFASIVLAACGGSPSVPSGTETITGAERFGWDQPAADAGELGSFRYALYLDGARSEASDVSCTTGSATGRFPCSARLPDMPAGVHTLEVAAFVLDGGAIRESTRSASVRVSKR
jgi:hypothetical protein